MPNIPSTQKIIGPLSLLTGGLLFGLSGVMAKYLSDSLNAYQIVGYRYSIALLGALLLAAILRKHLDIKGLDKRVLGLYAVTFPISIILFILSIVHGSVALAVFSFYGATLISSFILGRLFFSETIGVSKQIGLAFVTAAIIIFTDPLQNFSLNLGLVFGMLSGVIQGVASGFQKALSTTADRVSLLIVQSVVGVFLAALMLLVTSEDFASTLSGFQWIVVVASGLSMLAVMYLLLVGFKYTNLNTGSILISSELFFGPFFAFLLLSESLSANIIAGGILTACAVLFVNLRD